MHSITLFALLWSSAFAFWRMPCDTLLEERLDPLIAPGRVSGHVHQVFGGSNFGINLPSHATLQKSKCTSCHVTQDKSNYWSPSLYYHHKNGSFILVKSQGILAYYLSRGNEKKKHAFEKEFRMIAGDPRSRSDTGKPFQKAKAISFACLGAPGPETPYIPEHDCPNGLRAQIFFPSCGDGRTDSPDHTSHMAYPSGTSGNGDCPKSHPKKYVSIFIERLFSVSNFDRSQAMNSRQPFVFSFGDSTGYGSHADYINGWSSPEFLQRAIDTCTNDSGKIEDCPIFDIVNSDCHKSATVNEIVKGQPLDKLPGCNPVTKGPQDSPMQTCPTQPPIFPKPVAYTGKIPPPGTKVVANEPRIIVKYGNYRYKGCNSDVQWTRVLPTQLKVDGAMTLNKCLKACEAQQFAFCGLQFGSECFAGNTLGSASKTLPIDKCSDTCRGNPTQICGGGLALTLYTRQAPAAKRMKRQAQASFGVPYHLDFLDG